MTHDLRPLMDEPLIERFVRFDPRRPSEARLAETGVAVWVIVEYVRDVLAGDLDRAAQDYDLSVDAVRASLAFYRYYPAEIDARLLLNNGA